MSFFKISRKLLASTGAFISYKATCEQINKKGDKISYVQTLQYNANNPIQDRIAVFNLQRFKATVVAVFDGHGGSLCAEYASGNLQRVLNQRMKDNIKKTNSLKSNSQKSLSQAYDDLQQGFKSVFLKNIDKVQYKGVGSCALTAICFRDFVCVGNSGDCQGALLGGDKIIKLNNRHNAGQPEQQERLKKQFPNELDIIRCIKNTNYCYVKGRLQPTRSLGDFYLKSPEYNFTNLKIFTGPYITHKPEIKTFNLQDNTAKTLVVATDGLWDQLDENQMSKIIEPYHGTDQVAEKLFEEAIKKILSRNRVKSKQRLNEIQNRRNLHDDISIVTVNLQKLRDSFIFVRPWS